MPPIGVLRRDNHSERETMEIPRKALAVALVVAAGIGGSAANAKPSRHAEKFKRPHLVHGRLTVEGTAASDKIALRLRAGDPGTLEIDVGDDGSADFSFDRNRIAAIDVAAGAGDDLVRIDESQGVFTDAITTTIDGGDGNDTLSGGAGAETLRGGAGTDTVDGNGGNDAAFLGAGDDTFDWDPGDGSDTIEGQDGTDAMIFNGAGADERVGLSANGNRLTFVRSPGNITMDTAGVERVDFNAFGGADNIGVDDLSGTDVQAVDIDLGLDGHGDGTVDHVTVDGTSGNDALNVAGQGAGVAVVGGQPLVTVLDQDSSDQLVVEGQDGNDAISAAGLAAGTIGLTIDGGAGDDTLAGGNGIETLNGRDGDDTLDGNGGNDLALLGAGDDTFVWDPGDGSDVVEGQDGNDRMLFNGANGAEQVDLSANGNRLRFFRTQGTVTMDTAGVEQVVFNALGGADTATVNDLSGTDVRSVKIDLAGTAGGTTGDTAADRVVVNGTAGDDTISVKGDAADLSAKGLVPAVEVSHAEAANDRLEINTLAGTDTVDSSGLAAGAIQLFVDGALVP
jgi:Ca2+-binding RTX toxin-like protein